MDKSRSHVRTERRFCRKDVNVRLGVFSSLKFKVEYATQMSEGGVLMNCQGDYKAGERVILTFQLPNSELIIIDGEVAYTFETERGNFFAGLRFLHPSSDALAQIRSFVELSGT